MKYSVIIPAHNEEASIAKTIEIIEKTLNIDYELVVVNDHSQDSTVDIVKNLINKYPNLRLVDNVKPGCFGNALKTGFENAKGDYFVPVMADLCDDIITITEMTEKAEEGYDIICGSRYMSGGKKIGGPALQTFFSRTFGLSLHYLIGIPTLDTANAFKMYNRNIFAKIEINAAWFEISAEITLKAFFKHAKITEVPTTWRDRKEGTSKFNISHVAGGYFKIFFWAIEKYLALKFKSYAKAE